jgi:hypothetical protein
LKEEISLLKVDLKEIEDKISGGSDQASLQDAKNLKEKISEMEKQIELLTRELDDKIRFGQRPGSGAGRATTFPRSSLAEEPQATVTIIDRPRSRDRPPSRGGMESYHKPVEERWGFQGSRERDSFGGSSSSDRFVQFLCLIWSCLLLARLTFHSKKNCASPHLQLRCLT